MPFLLKKGVLLKKRDWKGSWEPRHFWLEHAAPAGPVLRYAYPRSSAGAETWDSSKQPSFSFSSSTKISRHTSTEGSQWVCGGSAPIPNCLRVEGLIDASNKQVVMVLIPQAANVSSACKDWIRALSQAVQLSDKQPRAETSMESGTCDGRK